MGLQTKGNGTIPQPVFPPDIVFYNDLFSCCEVPGRLLLALTICRGTGSMCALCHSPPLPCTCPIGHLLLPEDLRLGSHYLHMTVSLSFSYLLMYYFLSGDFVSHSNQSRSSVTPCHITLSLLALIAIRYFYIYLFFIYLQNICSIKIGHIS